MGRASVARVIDAFSFLCFWHPVGPHGGETLAEIKRRKLVDVETYGFTVWSFAPATEARVSAWRAELKRKALDTCSVLCCGNNTTDPSLSNGKARWLNEYSADLMTWKPLPHPRMTSYHRGLTKGGFVASGFFVTSIEVPETMRIKRPETWFRANGNTWEQGVVPTRGEYLVQRPRIEPEAGMRLRVLLSITYPYVVWLR